MGLLFALVVALFVISALLLTAFVLVQKGSGSSWFLGGQSGSSVLGVKSVSAMVWLTAVAFGLFLLLAMALNRMTG